MGGVCRSGWWGNWMYVLFGVGCVYIRYLGNGGLWFRPYGGLLWGFSKVTRCKSGTISGRYLNNGYVHNPLKHPSHMLSNPPTQPPLSRIIVMHPTPNHRQLRRLNRKRRILRP